MKKMSMLTLASLFVAGTATAQEPVAADAPFTFRPMLVIGIATGGDEMGELTYETGDSTEVSAGGGITLGGGFEVQSADKPFGATVTINYHSDSATASNADITMDRFEFTVLPYYQLNEQIQVSAGLSMHTGVELEVDFEGTETLEFDSALATIVELRYLFETGDMTLSGRFTSVEYEPTSYNGRSVSGGEVVDGSNLGLFFTWSFNN
ncbi:MAG: hypothetical protein HWE10_10665 [Gammaproteobacteria bacterium]|nr:hypothetical protein [Gammaproteobacteria bacterium]